MAQNREPMPWDEDEYEDTPRPARVKPLKKTDDLALVAPSVPLQWKNVPAEIRPFTDFKDEYLRSPYALDAVTLAFRWQDIDEPNMVYAFFQWPGIEDDRWKAQNSYKDATDPEWRLRWNQVMVQRFINMTENAMSKLRTGGDMEMDDGQWKFQPLSARKREALVKEVAQFFDRIRLLQGESTQIIDQRGAKDGGVTINQLLIQGMDRLPPDVQKVLSQSLTGGSLAPAPAAPSLDDFRGQEFVQ